MLVSALTGYTPYSGDIFFYYDSTAHVDHIGIVLASIDENTMLTIEGNVGGEIQIKIRDYSNVDGLYFIMNNSGGNVYLTLPTEIYGKVTDDKKRYFNNYWN